MWALGCPKPTGRGRAARPPPWEPDPPGCPVLYNPRGARSRDIPSTRRTAIPNPYDEDRTSSLVRKKSELTPEQYAHQRKMLIVSGVIMVVCIAAIVGILNLIG